MSVTRENTRLHHEIREQIKQKLTNREIKAKMKEKYGESFNIDNKSLAHQRKKVKIEESGCRPPKRGRKRIISEEILEKTIAELNSLNSQITTKKICESLLLHANGGEDSEARQTKRVKVGDSTLRRIAAHVATNIVGNAVVRKTTGKEALIDAFDSINWSV